MSRVKKAEATLAGQHQRARDLCAWLMRAEYRPQPEKARIEFAVPVHVTAHPEPSQQKKFRCDWFGAFYCEITPFAPTERAVIANAGVRAGEPRRTYRLYLLGIKPTFNKDKWLATYTLPEDYRQPLEPCYSPTDEWFCSFYSNAGRPGAARHDPYDSLPFSPMFCLALHQKMNFGYYAGHTVDYYEPRPYVRIPLTVERVV